MAVYVLDNAVGSSLEEVGIRSIERAGLRLPDNGDIGRRVRFRENEEDLDGEFTIVACQMVGATTIAVTAQ